jgi:hypothetical protein
MLGLNQGHLIVLVMDQQDIPKKNAQLLAGIR